LEKQKEIQVNKLEVSNRHRRAHSYLAPGASAQKTCHAMLKPNKEVAHWSTKTAGACREQETLY